MDACPQACCQKTISEASGSLYKPATQRFKDSL